MSSYTSINNYIENNNLPGAVSTESIFSFKTNSCGTIFKPIKDFVSKEYAEDLENNLFISRKGAVANAYDLKHLDEKEKIKTMKEILLENQLKHPEYEFVLSSGKFPIRYNKGIEIHGYTAGSYVTMSTHILYIKNYGQFIKRPRLLIKK